MSEESVLGAGAIKSINCLEKELGGGGESVPSAAITLVFVTGLNPGTAPQSY